MEIFNEFTVLIVTIFHYMTMYEHTEFAKSVIAKSIISWVLIITISINITVNIGSVAIKSIFESYEGCKSSREKSKEVKKLKEDEEDQKILIETFTS